MGKHLSELIAASGASDVDLLLIDTSDGSRAITFGDVRSSLLIVDALPEVDPDGSSAIWFPATQGDAGAVRLYLPDVVNRIRLFGDLPTAWIADDTIFLINGEEACKVAAPAVRTYALTFEGLDPTSVSAGTVLLASTSGVPGKLLLSSLRSNVLATTDLTSVTPDRNTVLLVATVEGGQTTTVGEIVDLVDVPAAPVAAFAQVEIRLNEVATALDDNGYHRIEAEASAGASRNATIDVTNLHHSVTIEVAGVYELRAFLVVVASAGYADIVGLSFAKNGDPISVESTNLNGLGPSQINIQHIAELAVGDIVEVKIHNRTGAGPTATVSSMSFTVQKIADPVA